MNPAFLHRLPKSIFLVVVSSIIVLVSVVLFDRIIKVKPNPSTQSEIAYTDFLSLAQYHFHFTVAMSQDEFTQSTLFCKDIPSVDTLVNRKERIGLYCRTHTGKDPSILFFWKSNTVTKKEFQKEVIVDALSESGAGDVHTTCSSDTTYSNLASIKGTVANCQVKREKSEDIMYFSFLYFYPKTEVDMGQVIVVQGLIPNTDTSVVSTMKNIMQKISLTNTVSWYK